MFGKNDQTILTIKQRKEAGPGKDLISVKDLKID